MSHTPTQPVAQGTLANTPFAHLVLYIYQRRSSGTLVVRNLVGGEEHAQRTGDESIAVLFHRGRAVAARVTAPAQALDQALLPLCSIPDAIYEFFEDDLVGSGAAIVTGMFDPYAFVTEAARAHTREDVVEHVLSRYAQVPLCVQPGMDLDRMLLSSQESSFATVLRDGTATIESLLASRKLPEVEARRLLYALLVTKVVGAYAPANDTLTGSQSSGAPAGLPAGQHSENPSSRTSNLTPEQRRRQSSAAWSAIAARAQQASRPISGPIQSQPAAGRSLTPPMASRQPTRPLTPPARAATRPLTPAPGRSVTPTPSGNPPLRSVTPPGSFGVRRSPTPPEMPTPPPGRVVTGTPLEQPPSGTPRVTTPSRPISRVTPRSNSEPLEALDAAGKFRRVEALCQRNAFDEALPIIRALAESERRNPAYLGMLASVLYGRGIEGTISKEIVDTVNQALRIHPDEVNALYTKARCYKRMGKNREALHYFKRTVSVDPAHLEAAREVRLLMLRQTEKKR